MRRRDVLLAAVGLIAAPLLRAQPAPGSHRIGILSARSRPTAENPDPFWGSFVQGMRELGYIEGKNLVIEWRYAMGDYSRLPALAADLVKTKPDAIISHTTPGTQALKRATSTIPIAMTSVSTPVESGLVASLARPGGNITGVSIMTVDLSPKLLELLGIMLPGVSRVGVLMNPAIAFHPAVVESVQAAARPRGIKVVSTPATTHDEIDRALHKMAHEGVQAVIVPADSFFTSQRHYFAEVALKYRLPTAHAGREMVEAGGLMSYGTSIGESYRRAATYVDKILKGAKPGDLPIEQPTKFELVINLKTAKALGVTMPQSLLLRADRVIE